jgi:hypothetical protein
MAGTIDFLLPTSAFAMDTTPDSSTPPSITIPAATTTELLHALSATVIAQHATITMMSGLLLQVYCTVNQLPMEVGEDLRQRLFSAAVDSANQGFSDSLKEHQQQLKTQLFQ